MNDGPKVVRTDSESLKRDDGWSRHMEQAEEPCVLLKLYLNGGHPLVDGQSWHIGSELDEGLLIPQSWFERLEKRVQIVWDRVERHCKPPFPPDLERLEQLVVGLNERLAAVEDLLKPVSPEVVASESIDDFYRQAMKSFDVVGRPEEVERDNTMPLTVLQTGVAKGSLFQCVVCAPEELEGLEERQRSLEQWMTQFTLVNHGRVLPSDEEMNSLEKRLAAVEDLLKPVSPEEVERDNTMPLTVLQTGVPKGSLFKCVVCAPEEIRGLDLSGFKKLLRLKIDVVAEDVLRQFKERETNE